MIKLIGIYKIYCIENNKCYIGSSKNIRGRWDKHKQMLRNNAHTTKHLQLAWNVYGKEYFTFSVLEECDQSQLLVRELY